MKASSATDCLTGLTAALIRAPAEEQLLHQFASQLSLGSKFHLGAQGKESGSHPQLLSEHVVTEGKFGKSHRVKDFDSCSSPSLPDTKAQHDALRKWTSQSGHDEPVDLKVVAEHLKCFPKVTT